MSGIDSCQWEQKGNEIFIAVFNGNVEKVEKILKENPAKALRKDGNGETPMQTLNKFGAGESQGDEVSRIRTLLEEAISTCQAKKYSKVIKNN